MVRKTLDEQLEDLYDKGYDRYKVEQFAERAAMMAAPTFQAHGIEYGDRVPGMYKLAETIEELFLNVLDENTTASTGLFKVERENADEDNEEWPQEFHIYLDLGWIYKRDLLETKE